MQKIRRDEEDDEKLPLRCVNAHTFCPRLAWLEHAEGLFAENEHTVQGHFVHRRVDKPGGELVVDDGPPWHARSLWLSDYAISYRRTIFVHARLLARYVLGELEVPPTLRTR